MKLLIDANLSWRLEKYLKETFRDVLHVENTVLPVPAKDSEIWNFAKISGYTILTNDFDFYNLLLIKGFPPKIILLQTGNLSTKSIVELLNSKRDEIELFETDTVLGLLEICAVIPPPQVPSIP
jgi:predicted nuclease of predicted toxin-antitoxin system